MRNVYEIDDDMYSEYSHLGNLWDDVKSAGAGLFKTFVNVITPDKETTSQIIYKKVTGQDKPPATVYVPQTVSQTPEWVMPAVVLAGGLGLLFIMKSQQKRSR